MALALVSSGQYVAGALWPPVIAFGIEKLGWRPTMMWFGVGSSVVMALAALVCLRPVPKAGRASYQERSGQTSGLECLGRPHLLFCVLLVFFAARP